GAKSSRRQVFKAPSLQSAKSSKRKIVPVRWPFQASGGAMRRREVIALVGGFAAAWPLVVRAQRQSETKKRIGVIIGRPENDPEGESYVAAFQGALEQLGWKSGHNVEIDYRWTAGNSELAENFANQLVAARPDVLVINGTATVVAARRAAGTIPIVMA